MVGSIVDPMAFDEDPLGGLVGPSAPGSAHAIGSAPPSSTAPTTSDSAAEGTSSAPWTGATPAPGGGFDAGAQRHPVRDKLLRRAQETRDDAGPLSTGLDELAEHEPGAPRSELDSELDRVALGSPPGTHTGPSLSPPLIALFGALLGLTTVGSLVALASSIDGGTTPAAAPQLEASSTAPEKVEAPKEETPKREKVPGPWRIADEKGKAGTRIITGRVGKNAFLRAIQDAGLKKSEAYRAYTALKGLVNLDRCDSSDTFTALLEQPSGKLKAFEYEKDKENVFQAKTGDDGYLQGQKLDLKVERNQVRRALAFDGNSFSASAKAAGFDPGLSGVLSDALSGHLSLSELEKGDRIRVIAQEVTVLGEFSRYAGVEAVEVLRKGKKPLRVYYYHHAVEGGHFDDSGKAPYEGGWRKPVPGAPVTSKFNMKRMHPVLKKVMPHTGTDFGVPFGDPIGASAPGKVSFIGPAGPSGNLVKVAHEGGYETGYAHLSRFAEGLKVGDKVGRLQTVGYCGSTGRSTGPHLHFTVKKNGEFIDPESLNLDGMRVLPPSHREAFAEVRTKYDALLDAIPLPAAPTAAPPPPEPSDSAPEDPSAEEDEPSAAEETAARELPEEAAAPAPKVAPAPASPAKPSSGSSIFMSDEELLRMQGLADDGEVSE